MKLKYSDMGLEAIDFQKDKVLFDGLVLLLGRCQGVADEGERQSIFSEITELVERRTNLKIEVYQVDSDEVNAAAMLLPLTKDHPFFDKARRSKMAFASVKDITEERVMDGAVDLRNSRVSGYFAKVVTPIALTRGFFNAVFSAEELAAGFLHELGHVFTYFEVIGKVARTSVVLQEVAEVFSDTRDVNVRTKILADVETVYGHRFEDKESLAKTDRLEVVASVVTVAGMEWIRSELGTKYYDGRISEFMADQFATRHGAGRHLMTFLDKANRLPANRKRKAVYQTTKYSILMNIKSFCLASLEWSSLLKWSILRKGLTAALLTTPQGFIANLLVSAVITTATVLIAGSRDYRYDDPKARYMAIRGELITSLKDRSLDPRYVKEQLDSIELIDSYVKQLKGFAELTSQIGMFFHDYLNGSYKELKFQRQYETLVNNDLFARAAQLNQLA